MEYIVFSTKDEISHIYDKYFIYFYFIQLIYLAYKIISKFYISLQKI